MDILFSEFLDKPVWMWLFFIVIVLVLLVLDLGVLHRNVREIGVKESLGLFSILYHSRFVVWCMGLVVYRSHSRTQLRYWLCY